MKLTIRYNRGDRVATRKGTLLVDRTGRKYGKLTALHPARTEGDRSGWMCRCECGVEKIVDSGALEVGNTKSCGGCSRKEYAKGNGKNWLKHGESGSQLHKCWMSIIRRRKFDPHYLEVEIEPEWFTYENFSKWAKENGWKDGLTIDRVDNNKGYSPENCRFATRAEQSRNRTTTKLNWEKVGEIRAMLKNNNKTHQEIAVIYGISRATVGDILNNKRWAVPPVDGIVA